MPFNKTGITRLLAIQITCLFLLYPDTAAAQDVRSNWRSLTSSVVREDPQLNAARHNVDTRKRETVAQYFGFMPDINVNARGGLVAGVFQSGGDFMKPSASPPGRGVTKDFINSFGYGVTGRLSLTSWGVRIASVQKAYAEQNIARHMHNETLSAVIKRALSVYSELYFAEQRRRLLANRVRILDEKLKNVARAVQKKQRTSFDQWNAELDSQFARENLLQAEEGLGRATAGFERIFQRKIDPKMLSEIDLPVDLIPASQDEARLLVTGRNPSFLIARERWKVAKQARNEFLEGVLPDIAIVGEYEDYTNRTASAQTRDQQYSIILEARYNIGRMPEALINMLAMSSRASSERALSLEDQRSTLFRFDESWHAFNGSKRKINLLRSAVKNNKRILDGQRRLGQRGAVDLVSIMDIEASYSRILERQQIAAEQYIRNALNLMEVINLLTVRALKLQ